MEGALAQRRYGDYEEETRTKVLDLRKTSHPSALELRVGVDLLECRALGLSPRLAN
ncbi:hypothetical protein C8J55DRAFT_520850 [Lentinula edodes]|uniref:Uncharacterized protein n=1 Tax=Lentinula lateritia TaxID=40482 RepID=A0A9W9A0G9_9AGAR|nr:hypothetical protein C8J55DRAFT_520850 [Lentinula edodes]